MTRLVALVGGTLALLAALVPGARAGEAPRQEYSVPVATLDAALDCTDLTANPDKEPVLLVHGTFTEGHEQYAWNWELVLTDLGFDHCVVTYPNRGLDDLQISAEYVARALEVMHERSGRKVDVFGHSQGAVLPRWAVKFFPQAQRAADDLVLSAGPQHGTSVSSFPGGSSGGPAVSHQLRPGSQFITALNRGDETPGLIDYTSLWSTFLDELVQPDGNVPGQTATAALSSGQTDPRVANVAVQSLCPGRFVDHLGIGTTDLATIDLVLDAFTNPGPADPARLDVVGTCTKGHLAQPEQLPVLLELLRDGDAESFPAFESLDEEPELQPYARPSGSASGGSGTGAESSGEPGATKADPASDGRRAAPIPATIPATGAAVPAGTALLLAAAGWAGLRLSAPRRRRAG